MIRTATRAAAFIVTAVATLYAGPAISQNLDSMTERELDKQLAIIVGKGRQLQDLSRLQSIGKRIARPDQCGPIHREAARSFAELQALNQQYRGRADRRYRQREEQLRQQNADAIRDYRNCFTEALQRLSLQWPEKSVVDYAGFQRQFTSLAVQLRGESEARLKQQAEALYAARQKLQQSSRFPFATLTAVHGDVKLHRDEKSIALERGINIHAGDQISTGKSGRLAIEFTEVIGGSRRGPFTLSIGPVSRIGIGWRSNMVVQDRKDQSIQLDVTLHFGTVRIVSIGAGFDSNYQVQAGKTRTQVLGADTVVSHYPRLKLVNTKLLSGVVEISQGSGNPQRLKPNQQLSVRAGVVQPVADLPPDQWAAALVAAGRRSPAARQPAARVTKPLNRRAAHDIERRMRARAAVDAMLTALRGANANGLLTSTSGEAQRNARHSMRRQSLRDVLRDSGRPVSWFHDCVACSPDGYCSVPTEVQLDGGNNRKYEVVHVVKPAGDSGGYTVDRIDPWDAKLQQQFRASRPLCEADLNTPK